MTEDAKTFLFELMNTPSPSGFEVEGQRKWAAYVRPHADEVASDTYGNAWATLHGSGGEEAPRIMLEAHADEIGFMVNYISDEGFLSITRIGGSDRAIARGRRVRILGSKGEVRGVIGNTAIHDEASFAAALAGAKPGDSAPITFVSRGETLTAQLTFAADPRLEIVADPAPNALRDAWLTSRAADAR